MKKKTFFILFIIYFLCLSSGFCEDGQFSVFPANDSAGKWEKVMFGEKEVIATDKAEAKQTIEIDIPEDGCYQLYVRLYHEWRECCPFVYIKIVDSKYKSYSNCLFSETRWYMPQDQGRWEYRSPSAEPFWSLHKGRAKISFLSKPLTPAGRIKRFLWRADCLLMSLFLSGLIRII